MIVHLFILWSVLAVACSAATSTDLSTFTTGTSGLRLIGSASDRMAYAVANAGDFNNDGIEDIIVGAVNYVKGTYVNAGLALVILGGDYTSATEIDASTFTSGSRGLRILGGFSTVTTSQNLGWSVGSAGDINHDGYDDVLVGAPNGQTGNKGAVYVIFGHAGPYTDISVGTLTAGSSGFTILGQAASSFGQTLGRALGDINGDGHDDFALTATTAAYSSRTACGAAWIIYGKASTATVTNIDLASLGSAGIQISGAFANDNLGFSMVNAGDVNGDGINDILIGATGYDVLSPVTKGSVGIVYLIYGSRTMAAMDLLTFTTGSLGVRYIGGTASDGLGRAVAALGDINGDGLADFAMTAIQADPPGRSNAGMAYVIFGTSTVQSADVDMATFTAGSVGYAIYGKAANSNLGTSVASAGDQNQDGIPDLIVGSQNTQTLFIVYGTSGVPTAHVDLATASVYTFTAPSTTSNLGGAVTGGKDFNGDGIADLLLAANQASVTPAAGGTARSNAGAAFAVMGPFSLGSSAPIAEPTVAPSHAPSAAPTAEPTAPTADPTRSPTVVPSASPSVDPSAAPTVTPTASPSAVPTTAAPTTDDSAAPSASPTVKPTAAPTIDPTASPSAAPTFDPTAAPTIDPTASPSATPTFDPTAAPTLPPTVKPTAAPTFDPTASPSAAPTADPSAEPTFDPTASPSADPTMDPTAAPTIDPTASPSASPTASPSAAPTADPSATPTASPTASPTAAPTPSPTASPTLNPTADPSADPTAAPTASPTVNPTADPTVDPTAAPTATPTADPSADPTVDPTAAPSAQPTFLPTAAPTFMPTARPTEEVHQAYVVTLVIEQTVYFMTAEDYFAEQVAYNLTIQHTVAASMDGVTPDRVTDIVVAASVVSEAHRRAGQPSSRAAADADSCFLSYTVSVHDPLLSFEELKEQVIEAATSGAMDASLHMYAEEFGADKLANGTFSVPYVRNAADTDDASDLLTGGEMAAIVVCSVFGAFLLAALVLYRNRSASASGSKVYVEGNKQPVTATQAAADVYVGVEAGGMA